MERVLSGGGELGHRHVDASAGMEEDLRYAATVHGLRFHVINVGNNGGERTLPGRSDALFHLFGAETGVVPERGDHGDVDIGEDVSGRAHDDQRADDQQQKRQHNKRVRTRYRDSNYPQLTGISIRLGDVSSDARYWPFITRRQFLPASTLDARNASLVAQVGAFCVARRAIL